MARKRIFEDDELGLPVSSERLDARPAVSKALAALRRHRVLLGSIAIAVVAVLAWRWTVRGESTPVAPSAGLDATSTPERQLAITVLGVRDAVAAAAPTAPPPPPVAVAPPPPPVAVPPSATAPASADAPATVSAPSRASSPPRSTPSRAQSSSAAKASSLPVAAVKSVPAQEPRVDSVPAKPQPKPDGPPMETNPYVYK